jgi:hypothetical protein
MKKDITIGPRPSVVKAAAKKTENDQFVKQGAEKEGTRRITFDVPASLHARVKGSCGLRGVKMIEELTALLEEKYPPQK